MKIVSQDLGFKNLLQSGYELIARLAAYAAPEQPSDAFAHQCKCMGPTKLYLAQAESVFLLCVLLALLKTRWISHAQYECLVAAMAALNLGQLVFLQLLFSPKCYEMKVRSSLCVPKVTEPALHELAELEAEQIRSTLTCITNLAAQITFSFMNGGRVAVQAAQHRPREAEPVDK